MLNVDLSSFIYRKQKVDVMTKKVCFFVVVVRIGMATYKHKLTVLYQFKKCAVSCCRDPYKAFNTRFGLDKDLNPWSGIK